MNVTILTPIPFWHPGTQELIDELRNQKINVRALDIFHGKIVDYDNTQINLKPSFVKGISAKVYMRLFRKRMILKHVNDGDIIDIHFVEPAYGRYVTTLKKKRIKLIATLFGSDLFRTNQEQKEDQKIIFETADAIVLSKNMVPHFQNYFPGLEEKFRFNQYGSLRLDLIDSLNSSSNKKKYREKYGISDEKIVISCGYNNKKEQQHIKLLDAIDHLSETKKKSLFLVLLMTYGDEEEEYLKQIREKLADLNIPSLCFENRLTDQELAEIRIISDITINTQTTDALASSIKEAMVAGDVMLIGDWLPYDIYRDLGAFYLTTSLEELSERLEYLLDNFDELCENSKKNKQLILDFASWNILIRGWIKLYKEA